MGCHAGRGRRGSSRDRRSENSFSPPPRSNQQPHVLNDDAIDIKRTTSDDLQGSEDLASDCKESDGSCLHEKPKQPMKPVQQKHIVNPNDVNALATLAPAQSVRAPRSPGHVQHSSAAASGLASPQIARSLGDWEVEDFVLLATVDGNLYASDRKTGTERWRLQVDHPMVDTKHFRANTSILDDDYSPVDHYIWAVEPNKDGGLFVWIPQSGAGLVRTGFTMKRLVEELAPYAGDEPLSCTLETRKPR